MQKQFIQSYTRFFEEHHGQKGSIKNMFGSISKKSYPASVTFAQFHSQISKYGEKIQKIQKIQESGESNQQKIPICPCCSHQVIVKSFPLCHSTSIPSRINIGENKFQLNSGICLFFMFIKMCIYYLILRLILTDGYNIYTSLKGHYCRSYPQKCTEFIQSILAGYNKHTLQDEPLLKIMDILNFALSIASIIFFLYFRIAFQRVHVFLDSVDITDDDYSVMVENIPLLVARKEDGKNSFEVTAIEDNLNKTLTQYLHKTILNKNQEQKYQQIKDKLLIANISLCFETSQFENLKKIKNNIFDELLSDPSVKQQFQRIYRVQFEQQKQKIKDTINSFISMSRTDRNNKIQHQILKLECEKIRQLFYRTLINKIQFQQQLQNRKQSGDNSIQNYLTLINWVQVLAEKACKRYADNQSNHTLFIGKAFVTFEYQHLKNLFLEEYQKGQKLIINNKVLQISSAAEPDDVIWENLKVTQDQRGQAVIFSLLILFMCIGFSFIFTLLVEAAQLKITETMNHTNQTSPSPPPNTDEEAQTLKLGSSILENRQLSQFFNRFMVVLTTLVNLLLDVIIRRITEMQRHKSKTDKIYIMINRLVVSKFLNTCVIYFILYMVNSSVSILSENGLMNKILQLVTISAGIDIALNIFLPGKIIKLLYYKYTYSSVSFVSKTQQQLNQELSLPQFDLVQRYSYYIVQIYLISFYAYLCPLTCPLLILIFILQYWIDKINLFKRCSVNDSTGFQLSKTTIQLCTFSTLIFSVGNIIFYQIINIYAEVRFTIFDILTLLVSLLFVIFMYKGSKRIESWLYKHQSHSLNVPYQQFIKSNPYASTYQSTNPATAKLKPIFIRTSQKRLDLKEENIAQVLYNKNESFMNIFLPDQLSKYYKWQDNYRICPEGYDKQDVELFNKCFQLES